MIEADLEAELEAANSKKSACLSYLARRFPASNANVAFRAILGFPAWIWLRTTGPP